MDSIGNTNDYDNESGIADICQLLLKRVNDVNKVDGRFLRYYIMKRNCKGGLWMVLNLDTCVYTHKDISCVYAFIAGLINAHGV